MSTRDSCLWGCNNRINNKTQLCTYTAGGNMNCQNDIFDVSQYTNNIDTRSKVVNIPGVCFQNCDVPNNNKRFEQPILKIGSDSGKYTKFIMRDLF